MSNTEATALVNAWHTKKEPAGATKATTAGPAVNTITVDESAAERKRFVTLRAQFALTGHSLHQSERGGYYSQRWSLVRDLPSLDAAEAFLERIGGRHG